LILIPVVALCIGLTIPIVTLGWFDASIICGLIPGICQALHLAIPDQYIAEPITITTKPYNPIVSLEFFNRMDIPIDTYWKDYAGEEQFWFTIESFSYTGNISSIRGHVWSFRSSTSGDLLFEENIDITHCGKIHIAPSEHIEALRQYCAETGRAVIGHWPRAPLVRHVPKPLGLGQTRQFSTEHVQFQSYEGRMKSLVKDMTVKTIGVNPHLIRVDEFLSSEECDYLMELSGPRLLEQDDNSASSTWLEHGESPIVAAITRRIFDLMGFESDVETFYFAEKMQISRFTPGQQYLPHFDAMDLTTSQRNLPHNRFATVMLYLNDIDEKDGGADVWPRANNADEFKRLPCDAEFRIQPKQGTLMVLYSMFGDGVIDEASLHGSCPVTTENKEKWTANLFFWDPFVQWSPEQFAV